MSSRALPFRLFVLLCSAVIASVLWALLIQPRAVEHEWREPLKSASFAPFRDGQSPLKEVFPPATQIEEDLVRLKGLFAGVRTYTATGGMEVVPELAARHDFTLTHSAWLGREEEPEGKLRNEAEIAALIEQANRYPEAVQRVIVGNEVLLRRDLTAEQLIGYIDRVRGAIRQPVSYADVWAFWLKNPQVAEHVDYITIHILPYWEDEPVSVHVAEEHMLAIIERIKQRFPGKPILVGETGWPTEGRSRGPAHADLVTAAQFVRHLPQLAVEHDFDYNVVEAFDQPWKAQLEGTVGARWGLIDAHRQQKFALSGPVVPLDHALSRALVSVLLGIVATLLLLPALRGGRQVLVWGLWAQCLGAAAVWSIYKAVRLTDAPASFTWMQQHLLFALADRHWLDDASVAFWYKLLLQQLAEPLAVVWGWIIAVFAAVFALATLLRLRALLLGNGAAAVTQLMQRAYGWYGLSAVVFAAMFASSGRYIDIPLPHVALPLVGALGLWCLSRQGVSGASLQTRCAFFNRHAVLLLVLAALACLWGEVGAMLGGEDFITMHPTLAEQLPLIAGSLLANRELLAWCVLSVMLALPLRALRPR